MQVCTNGAAIRALDLPRSKVPRNTALRILFRISAQQPKTAKAGFPDCNGKPGAGGLFQPGGGQQDGEADFRTLQAVGLFHVDPFIKRVGAARRAA